ncbi:Uncharacterised protein [Bordetella ansorpii]|uniref:Uncharacterized protein n=1 Tax=Bordetella ansorpii TaxID=288768 RepID=A0A157RMV3_9BORD|nr:Uncharacterised protein [Bordetella ansorpii]
MVPLFSTRRAISATSPCAERIVPALITCAWLSPLNVRSPPFMNCWLSTSCVDAANVPPVLIVPFGPTTTPDGLIR